MDGIPLRAGCSILAAACVLAIASSAPARAADPSIALILGVKGSPFDDALACGALDAAKKLGLHVDLFAPDHFTGESQAPVVDAVTARKPTITIISPADATGVTRPLKQMAERGTKIITVDTVVADPSFVASEVITSNVDGGKTAATAMIEAIGGKGPVLVITNPPGSVAQERTRQGVRGRPEVGFRGDLSWPAVSERRSSESNRDRDIDARRASGSGGHFLDQRSGRDWRNHRVASGRRNRARQACRL
jgi:ABC-type sugar transport system substrate-binding protein